MIAPVSVRKNPKLFPVMRLAGIVAPVAFWQASAEERAIHSNGCGPGGWIIDLVPDSLESLNITEECDIHDWYYSFGTTDEDKKIGDRIFRFNLRAKVRMNTTGILLLDTRLHLAELYFEAVDRHGHNAFYDGKVLV